MKNQLPTYVVITPVRNEVHSIPFTINSMLRQTMKPLRWIIIDDGSSDGTGALLDSASILTPWIEVIHGPDRGFRSAGKGVIEAFYRGYSLVEHLPWMFIAKLDGDLSFGPSYFEECLRRFNDDRELGLAGGTITVNKGGTIDIESK